MITFSKIGEENTGRTRQRAQKDDRRRGVSAKYRNPDNPAETWAGRGRKPKWIEGKLAYGATLDDLLISRATPEESGVGADRA